MEHGDHAIDLARTLQLTEGNFWARLQLLKGDISYILPDVDTASEVYANGVAASSPLSFERAWCSWRIALLREDPDATAQAARAFEHLRLYDSWARALGARGALLIKSGRRGDGLRCFEQLVEGYFVRREPLVGPAVTVALTHVVRLASELEGRAMPEAEFPGFGVDAYERVLPDARPKSGPAVAYYVLADAYDLVGERAAAQEAIGRAVDLLGQDMVSRNILPVLIKRCLEGLSGTDDDRPLIRKCVDAIFSHEASGDSAPPPVLSLCVFAAADRDFEQGRGSQHLTMLTDVLQEALAQRTSGNDFWAAEILLRQARIAKAQGGDASMVASLCRNALETGRVGRNGSVVLQAGHLLGFELAADAGTLSEVAAAQFGVIDGIELQAGGYDRLDTLGANLLNFWSSIEYRRLSEHDLGAVGLLRDPARQMTKAGTPLDLARAAMVLLLARLFDHSGQTSEWANEKVKDQRALLPEDTARLIKL